MRSIIYLAFFLISSCCSYDYDLKYLELNSNEKNIIESLNINDILFFKSDMGNLDTIKVVSIDSEIFTGSKCFISREPSSHHNIKIEHLPSDKYSGKTFTNDGYEIDYQKLVSLSKYPLENKVEYIFNFKEFYFLTDSIQNYFTKSIEINNTTYEDVYILKDTSNEFITNINWSLKEGILSYGNDYETWIRYRK